MCPFYLSLDVLAEVGSFSAEAEQVLVLCMVQHLDGVAFKDVLELIILQDVVWFSSFLVYKAETVDRVDLDTFGNVHPFLHDVLTHLFTLIVGLEVVEVD